MKKYDFSKHELWFSFRALQMLACAERRAFSRHIKNMQRKITSREMADAWKYDEVYVAREEAGRDVRRRTGIFDLRTSYWIISEYSMAIPSDFRIIVERMRELYEQENKSYVDSLIKSLREQGISVDFLVKNYYTGDDIEVLRLLANGKTISERKRKRLILDARGGIFKIVEEGVGISRNKQSMRPSFFRLAPRV